MKADRWMQDFINERISYYEKHLADKSNPALAREIEEGLKVLKQLQGE